MAIQKSKARTFSFTLILIICIIAIEIVIYWGFFANEGTKKKQDQDLVQGDIETILNDFNKIFTNNIIYNAEIEYQIPKINSTQEAIYTSYQKNEVLEQGQLNVNIPRFNVNSAVTNEMNIEIENTFQSKAVEIIEAQKQDCIYTVEYVAYINSDIISLVIKTTLKDNDNAQRVVVKTYNYDFVNDREVTLSELIQNKNLEEKKVQEKIIEMVKEQKVEAERLEKLGYDIYTRDPKSEIYEIQNTINYFLGENNRLYILYPYGNSNYTSEVDVIIFK